MTHTWYGAYLLFGAPSLLVTANEKKPHKENPQVNVMDVDLESDPHKYSEEV